MKRRAFIRSAGRGVVGLALAPAVAAAQTSAASADARQLPAILEREIPALLEESRVPGLSIAVIRAGRLVWRRGFGVTRAGSNRRVGHDTVFNVGSMSKTVFAEAVMKLHERRVLDLDTPLVQYAPLRILEGDARLSLITARHVLSQFERPATLAVRR